MVRLGEGQGVGLEEVEARPRLVARLGDSSANASGHECYREHRRVQSSCMQAGAGAAPCIAARMLSARLEGRGRC